MYIYRRADWPGFHWDQACRWPTRWLRCGTGRGGLSAGWRRLAFGLREEAVLNTLTQDVLKSSEIEGEILDSDQVRSSIARRLGLDIGGLTAADRHVEGVVEMMLDATQNYQEPLTAERLFGWHAALFPTGRERHGPDSPWELADDHTGPMQVVSGPIGREKVHFEAPAARTAGRGDGVVP